MANRSFKTDLFSRLHVRRKFAVIGLKHRTPKLFKGLLFLFVFTLALAAIRLFPSTASEGWRPTVLLLFALCLIGAALVSVFRTR